MTLYDPLQVPATEQRESRPMPEHLRELCDWVLKENQWGTLVCAIDPGDVHVGVAIGGFPPSSSGKSAQGEAWEPTVYRTIELTQAEVLYFAAECFRVFRAVVIEYFALYADKAKAQIGSTMPTSRLIGALEYIACVAVEGTYYGAVAIRRLDHFLFEQPASIQEACIAQLRARGVKSHAKTNGTGDHCLSAELHFYYFMFELMKKRDAALAAQNPTAKVEKSKFDSSGEPRIPKRPTKKK